MSNLVGFALTNQQFYIGISVLGAIAVLLAAVIVWALVKKKSDKSVQRSNETLTVQEPEATEFAPSDLQEEPVKEQNTIEATAVKQKETNAAGAVAVPTEPKTEQSAPVQTVVRYNKSFLARLIQSKDTTKRYFAEIGNYLLSYGLHKRVSWHCVTFRKGRQAIAKLNVRGKSLCVYLASDIAYYVDTKYRVEDVSEIKRYQDVPLCVRVRSDRAEKYAFELIDDLASRLGLTKGDVKEFSASNYPYESTESLLERRLIKLMIVKGDGGGEMVREPIRVVKYVTVEQAETLMSDSDAKNSVEIRQATRTDGKKCIVNVNALSAKFQNGDTVNLQSLKGKKLVSDKCGSVKILARGVLDKALTVEADDFSLDAVKMIVLTGGKVIKLR